MAEAQLRNRFKFLGGNFQRVVVAIAQLADARDIDIEADHIAPPAECDR